MTYFLNCENDHSPPMGLVGDLVIVQFLNTLTDNEPSLLHGFTLFIIPSLGEQGNTWWASHELCLSIFFLYNHNY